MLIDFMVVCIVLLVAVVVISVKYLRDAIESIKDLKKSNRIILEYTRILIDRDNTSILKDICRSESLKTTNKINKHLVIIKKELLDEIQEIKPEPNIISTNDYIEEPVMMTETINEVEIVKLNDGTFQVSETVDTIKKEEVTLNNPKRIDSRGRNIIDGADILNRQKKW